SMSMSAWVGSNRAQDAAYYGTPGSDQYRVYIKEGDVRYASKTWYLICEHENSINDGFFLVDMTSTRPFTDFPSRRHNRGYVLSFLDSHTEVYKMTDSRSFWPVPAGSYVNVQPPGNVNTPSNPDFVKLQSVTTIKN